MFGFLLKTVVIAAVVATIGGFVYLRRGSLPHIPSPNQWLAIASDSASKVDFKILAKNTSDALDNLIVNPKDDSPVVLGVKITNESLGKVVDVLQGLPPDQFNQLKQAICTSSSENE